MTLRAKHRLKKCQPESKCPEALTASNESGSCWTSFQGSCWQPPGAGLSTQTRTQFAAINTLGFTGWAAPTTCQVLTSSYELSAVLCSARPTQGTMYCSTNLAPCKLTHVPRPCCAPKLRNRQVDGNMRCYRTHNRKSCYKFIRRRHLRRCTCVPEI